MTVFDSSWMSSMDSPSEGLAEADFSADGANTEISLFYRCGANYKSFSAEVLAGRVGRDALVALFDAPVDIDATDGLGVYTQNLGLSHPMMVHGLAYDDEHDHAIVSISRIAYVDAPATSRVTAAEFEEKVRAVVEKGWDVSAAVAEIDGTAFYHPTPKP